MIKPLNFFHRLNRVKVKSTEKKRHHTIVRISGKVEIISKLTREDGQRMGLPGSDGRLGM